MYYSTIGFLAALVLLVENQDILFTRRDGFGTPAWKSYRGFLIAVLVYYASDIAWGILESQKLSGPLFLDTSIYFASIAVSVLFWTQFAVRYLDDKSGFGDFLLYAGRVFCGAVLVLVVINAFAPILFSVDEQCVYTAGPVRYAALGTQIVLLLLTSAYALSSMHQADAAKRNRYRAIALFGLITAVFLIAQIWFPYLPLYSVAYMLGISLLHTFVVANEREEYKLGMMAAEDRAREAAKVAELQRSFAIMFDNIPGMSFAKDAETGVYIACNQAFAEYAHKENPEGVIGLTDEQIFDPETARHFVEDDRVALSMDEPYIFFEDVPDAVGKHRQLQTTKLKYTDASGRLCTLGMCADVTDLVRIQHEYAMTKEDYERERSIGIIHAHIAQALAHSFEDLYYVNLETEEFIEYRANGRRGALTEVRRGENFFDECKADANVFIHPDDRAAFKRGMDRETLVDALDRNGSFAMTYRLVQGDESTYVNMRVSRMQDDERFIVIGVANIDEEMRQRKAVERAKEESLTYARINALAGNYICIFAVDPETDRYLRYSSTDRFDSFELPEEGEDFFGTSRTEGRGVIHPDDLERYLDLFSKADILSAIERDGIYTLRYRLFISGKSTHVQLKAALIDEKDGPRLIVGISDIDSVVHQEEEYAKRLTQAQSQASQDALTGVKNRHAFLNTEEQLDRQIEERRPPAFAIVIFDVNDLKKVNDAHGHKAGDQYLRDACKVICDIFKHSPVFRIGGDEFAVVAQGSDYDCIDNLMEKVAEHNAMAARVDGAVIACGMAKYEGDESVAPVFERADLAMYENKSALKATQAAD